MPIDKKMVAALPQKSGNFSVFKASHELKFFFNKNLFKYKTS